MSTASKILIVAGMLNLMIGVLSGIPMGLIRQRGAPEQSPGPRIGTAFGPLHIIGLGLATVCTFSGL